MLIGKESPTVYEEYNREFLFAFRFPICYHANKMTAYSSLTEGSEEFDELHMEYKAYAISSLIFATEFLEAVINKIFADAEDYMKSHDSGASDYAIWQTMRQEEKRLKSIRGGREILKKFDLVLFSARKKGLARTRTRHPYEEIDHLTTFQRADLLVNLRNAYIHYFPKWRAVLSENLLVERVDEPDIDVLRNRFPLNQLLTFGSSHPFFPEKCLGYGCAAWSVNASIQFVEEFYKEINKEVAVTLLSPLDNIKPTLKITP